MPNGKNHMAMQDSALEIMYLADCLRRHLELQPDSINTIRALPLQAACSLDSG